jgi:5-methylcytosine-specific restriction endonuclease McrA
MMPEQSPAWSSSNTATRRGRHRNSHTTPALRLAVYEKSGWRCVLCGIGPGRRPDGYDPRHALLVRTRYRLTGSAAQRARETYDILEIDHIVAYADGGPNKRENRQALCTLCNLRKGRG